MASDRVSRACPAVLVWPISCVSIFGRGGGRGGGRGRGRRVGEGEKEGETGRGGEWESGREQAGQAETGTPYPLTLSPHPPPPPLLHSPLPTPHSPYSPRV